MWPLTVDPVLRFINIGPVHTYGIIGAGYYRRTVQFTRPTTAVVTVFNSVVGYFGPAICTCPANQVLGTITKGADGANAGLGASIKVAPHASLYIRSTLSLRLDLQAGDPDSPHHVRNPVVDTFARISLDCCQQRGSPEIHG